MKKKEKIIIIIIISLTLICMILTVIVGLTYAYWAKTAIQSGVNVISTGCIDIEFTESNDIYLQKTYPISDEEGLSLKPYTFTIKNTCNDYAGYQINIETMKQPATTKVLSANYIRMDLQEKDKSTKNITLQNDMRTEKTLETSEEAYKIRKGYLKPKETKTFKLRLWMDKDTPAIEDSMNATFKGKIIVNFTYMSDLTTLMKRPSTNQKYYEYASKITKVVFQDELKPIATELSWDVSNDDSGLVWSYLVPNEDDETKYTLYLQQDGGVVAPVDSSKLFQSFKVEEFENMIYFDTSNVTDMSYMFSGCSNLSSIDLSSFDTSNVTDMSKMFSSCSSLRGLNVSSFDTRNVRKFDGTFYSCTYLEELDLSNFNTRNATDMNSIFYRSGIKKLNLSNWDFNNLSTKSMDSFFASLSALEEINLTNANTSEITNMRALFAGCKNLKELDLSAFNTSKVTNMKSLVDNCNLKTLNLSNWNFNSLSNKSMSGIFQTAGIESLYILNANTSEITDMMGLFASVNNLKNLYIDFDTSKVMTFNGMFSGAGKNYSDANINIGVIDISSGTSALSMLNNARNVSGIINVKSNISIYYGFLSGASVNQLVINYNSEYESIVDRMIATSTSSNVKKGTTCENLLQKSSKSSISTGTILYSESVTYENDKYTLNNPKVFSIGSDNYTLIGTYISLSPTTSSVYYVTNLNQFGELYKYIELSDGVCATN